MVIDRIITRLRNGLRVDGRDETINSVAVTIIFKDGNDDVFLCTGTTVPTSDSAGFAKGGQFIKTDAADGTKAIYENQGTNLLSDFNLIGDISSAEIADGAITSAKMASALLRFAEITLTAAEVKALVATPIEIVPATEAGAGFAIVPIAVLFNLTAGSEVFAETDDNLTLEYSGGANIQIIESTGFIDQATDQNRYQEIAETLRTPVENEAIDVTVDNGEITGNATEDATILVRVYYRVVPVV